MKLAWGKWTYGLAAAGVTGLANSFLSALGVGAADWVGVNVPSLDAKQLTIIALVGGFVGAAAYLKQSPVPKDLDEPQAPPPAGK